MKVLVLSNGEFEVRDIENTLGALQEIVGGYIEVPYFGEQFMNNGIDVIINEEGKLIDGLKKEIVVMDRDTQSILDIVCGNCVFASHDKDGETVGLNEDQINIVKNVLNGFAYLTDMDKCSVARVFYI